MSSPKRRSTFISYSRINKDFALQLAKELKSSGFDIWLDQLDIPIGEQWDDAIEQALEECEIFMVILTPASSTSNNVKDEIGYAIDSGKRILPILLENAKVPLRLRRLQYVDFTKINYEEGVERAKQLIRRLIDEPTVPRDHLEEVSSLGGDQPGMEINDSKLVIAPSSRLESPQADKQEYQAPKTGTQLTQQSTDSISGAVATKSRLPLVLGAAGAGLLAIGAFVVFALMSGNDGDIPDTGSAQITGASPTPAVFEVGPTNTLAPEPTAEATQPTSTIEPTVVPDTPTPGVQKFFIEEFDGDLSSWQTNFTLDAGRTELLITPYDDESTDVKIGVIDGFHQFDILHRVITAYSIYDPFVYNDVRIDVRVDSQSIRSSKVSLICRYSPEGGWYEFNIANNGEYSIRLAQPRSNGVIRYTDLWSGSFSRNVRTGNAINEYSIVCQGYDLSLYINGELERQTSDIQRTLRTGKVGISASSLNDLPINIGYDWVKISEPE